MFLTGVTPVCQVRDLLATASDGTRGDELTEIQVEGPSDFEHTFSTGSQNRGVDGMNSQRHNRSHLYTSDSMHKDMSSHCEVGTTPLCRPNLSALSVGSQGSYCTYPILRQFQWREAVQQTVHGRHGRKRTAFIGRVKWEPTDRVVTCEQVPFCVSA